MNHTRPKGVARHKAARHVGDRWAGTITLCPVRSLRTPAQWLGRDPERGATAARRRLAGVAGEHGPAGNLDPAGLWVVTSACAAFPTFHRPRPPDAACPTARGEFAG